MPDYCTQRSLINLIDIQEFKSQLPDLGIGLRLLLPDGQSENLTIHSDPLDDLINENPSGKKQSAQRDARILNHAHRKQEMFFYHCPTGVRMFVAPIYTSEGCSLGVIVSSGIRSNLTDVQIGVLAKRFRLDPDAIRQALQQFPQVDLQYHRTIVQLAHALLSQRVDAALHNEFLSEALAQRDIDALLDLIVNKIPAVIWGKGCSVFLWEDEQNRFILARTSSERMSDQVGREGYERGDGLTGWVGKYGKPLRIRDVSDPNELMSYEDMQAGIPAPVWSGSTTGVGKIMEGQVGPSMIVPIQDDEGSSPIGVMRLSNQIPGGATPTPRHFELFCKIAKLIFGAIQNAKLMKSVLSITKAFGEFDVDEVLQLLLNYIAQVFRSFSSHIRVRDKNREFWYVVAINSPHHAAIARRRSAPTGRLWKLIASGEPYHLDNSVQEDLEFKQALSEARKNDQEYWEYLRDIGAALTFLLRDNIGGEIVGTLHLRRRLGERFEDHEVQFLAGLAPVLGTVVTALKLADRKKGEDAALRDIDIRDPDFYGENLLKQILNSVLYMIDCDVAMIREPEQGGSRLNLAEVTVRSGVEYEGAIPTLKALGEGGSGRAAQERCCFYIPNTDHDPVYIEERTKAEAVGDKPKLRFLEWTKSEIAVPMLVADVLVGVLVVISSTPEKFQPRDADKLEAFAGRVALVLHVAHLMGDLDRRHKQLEGVYRATQKMLDPHDEATIFRIALTAATDKPGLGFCRALILLKDNGVCRMTLPLARGAATWQEQQMIWGRPAAGDFEAAIKESADDVKFEIDLTFNALVKPLTLRIEHVPLGCKIISLTGESWERAVLDQLDSEQAVIAPLRAPGGQELVGAIIADNRFLPSEIQQYEADSLQVLATLVAGIVSSLRHARSEADAQIEAAKMKTWQDVAARAAHQVGNRVYSVADLLGLLRDQLRGQPGMEEVVNELIPRVRAGVEDARQFLRDFVAFTRPAPLSLRKANLNDLVGAAVKESAILSDGTSIRLDENVPVFWCDTLKVKHCFSEMIQNAREAGATRVEITTKFVPEAGHAEVHICNNGSRIPGDMKNRIFEPLFTTKTTGTGWGLAIVKKHVELHKGTIRVETDGEADTCFVLQLPILSREELEDS